MTLQADKSPALLPSILHRPGIWLVSWGIWGITLWILSGGPPPVENDEVGIPNIDKILHAGYFFGGSGLLSACLWLKKNKTATFKLLLIAGLLINGAIGVIDEYHQSLHPERSGNSLADLAADLTGIVLGVWIFWKYRKLAFGPAT